MLDTRIILSGIWAATMLTFLWGDVLGLISGHTEAGKIGGSVFEPTHGVWVGIAALMLIPVLMIAENAAQYIAPAVLIIAGAWVVIRVFTRKEA